MTSRRATTVSLLGLDHEIAHAIPAADHSLADRHGVAVVQADVGTIVAGSHGEFGRLVVGGLLWREVRLNTSITPQALGPGAVVLPPARTLDVLPAAERVVALAPSRVALLDERFARALGRWPAVAAVIAGRLADQQHDLAVHAAICMLPRVEERILAFLWRLAERCGKVGPDGVRVPLRLTHERLGSYIGAQRPTVSLAITTLRDQGRLERGNDGSWLLLAELPDHLIGDPTVDGVVPPVWIPRATEAMQAAHDAREASSALRAQSEQLRSKAAQGD